MSTSLHWCAGCARHFTGDRNLSAHCIAKPETSACRRWYHEKYVPMVGLRMRRLARMHQDGRTSSSADNSNPLCPRESMDIDLPYNEQLTESNVLDDIEDDTDFNHLLNPLPNVAGDGDTRNKEDEQDDDDGDDDNEREDDFGPDSDVTDNEDGLWGRTCSTEEEAGSDGHQRREDDEYLALLAELDLEQDLREDHVRGQEEALDMEDGMEDDFSKIDHAYTKYFPGAAADYGLGTTLSDKFKSDRFADIRAKYNNIFYPFASQKEWEFTNVLLRIHCSLSEKTELVKTQLMQGSGLSYKTAQKANELLEHLPAGPQWSYHTITVDGYEPLKPIILFMRNARECTEYLFNNPLFADRMSLVPIKQYTKDTRERVITEPISAKQAWETQKLLPRGATRLGIVLASDATHLSAGTGDLTAHPLLLSLDNIHSKARRNSSNHAFLLLALLPKPQFPDNLDPSIARALRDRILHKCIRIVCAPFREMSKHGQLMSDPTGRLRNCFTVLSMYMVDYPEATKLAGVTSFTSPVTMAKTKALGDSFRHERRWWHITKKAIDDTKALADPIGNIKQYVKLANKQRLTGATELLWDGWEHCEPAVVLGFDILHSGHKYWKDHPFSWAVKSIGSLEIDARYRLLHSRIGWRHFHMGVSSLKKTGGRDHRDMQRYLLAVLDGAVPPQFISLLRAYLDYTYIAQKTELTEADFVDILNLLHEFHSKKDIVHEKGYREVEGFIIPKLELQHHIVPTMIANGHLLGCSTDISEHEHIQQVKDPFEYTNRKDFEKQMVGRLDKLERLRHFDLVTAIEAENLSDSLRDRNSNWLLNLSTIQNLRHAKQADHKDYFAVMKKLESSNLAPKYRNRIRTFKGSSFTAIHLTREAEIAEISIQQAAALFQLPDLYDAIREYFYSIHTHENLSSSDHESSDSESAGLAISRCPNAVPASFSLDFEKIRVWFAIRVQTRSLLEPGKANKTATICTQPPSEEWPLGRSDFALFANNLTKRFKGHADLKDHCVGQIRMTFQPLNSIKMPYLVYAQRLDCSHASTGANRNSGLFRLKRVFRRTSDSRVRLGAVVDASRIRCAVDVAPYFSSEVDGMLTSKTAIELCEALNLNKYSDKETFHLLRECTRAPSH